MMYNIVGDVAGNYSQLMKLIELMPKDNKIILVGDIVDRGPDSKKVIEFAMNNPNVITLKGNHEQMMIDAYYSIDPMSHVNNGGKATLKSYHVKWAEDYPQSHIEWLDELPICAEREGLFVSHAPWDANMPLGETTNPIQSLWNREDPSERMGVFQVFGHNHVKKIYRNYAICIDNCGNGVLTGITFPDKVIYEVQL